MALFRRGEVSGFDMRDWGDLVVWGWMGGEGKGKGEGKGEGGSVVYARFYMSHYSGKEGNEKEPFVTGLFKSKAPAPSLPSDICAPFLRCCGGDPRFSDLRRLTQEAVHDGLQQLMRYRRSGGEPQVPLLVAFPRRLSDPARAHRQRLPELVQRHPPRMLQLGVVLQDDLLPPRDRLRDGADHQAGRIRPRLRGVDHDAA